MLGIADQFRFLLQKLKYGGINKRFLKAHPKIVFPPPYYIYETYKLRYDEYWLDGIETAREIMDMFENVQDWPKGPVNILDWGCGPGRVVRHIPSLLPQGSTIYGIDYNPRYIQWCQRHIKTVQFFKSRNQPPFDLSPASVNGIISISVLTHLSAPQHIAWIDELHRVLKPGGLIYLTTQGAAFKSKLTAAEIATFERGELVTRESQQEGSRLYSAFQPESFIKQRIEGKFRMLEFNPGIAGKVPSQDLWLLQKTGN